MFLFIDISTKQNDVGQKTNFESPGLDKKLIRYNTDSKVCIRTNSEY